MDGVLADFFGQVAKKEGASHWRRARKEKERIDQVAQDPGFFASLPPLPNADKLIRSVVKMAGGYSILSSPLMSEIEQSTREKADWLKRKLKGAPPQSILFDHNKEKFAQQANGTPNILIDDYETNIRLWRNNGGIGIIYKDSEIDRVLRELTQALHGQVPVDEETEPEFDVALDIKPKLLTNQEVLRYIKDIHTVGYTLNKPVLKHKIWVLHRVPVEQLNTPEHYDQDDPYRRIIDIDWDHVNGLSNYDIETRPVVADENGWLLDGNHRVIAARQRGIDSVPAITPYLKS